MKITLPAILAALPVLFCDSAALAEPSRAGSDSEWNVGRAKSELCPSELFDRGMHFASSGGDRNVRGDKKGNESRRERRTEELVPEILSELLREGASDDQRTDEAALIVGALLGLAALERASREAVEEEDALETVPVPGLIPEADSSLFPNIPARPAEIETAAAPEPDPVPLAPPTVVGEPSLVIPPPPPLADIEDMDPSSDFSEALERAEQGGETGF